jgi:hypothetical protein
MKLPSISALMYQIPADKANHFIYGIVLFILLVFALSPLAALVAVTVTGIVKEVYDKVTGTGTPDYLDAVATALGGLAGYICTLV